MALCSTSPRRGVSDETKAPNTAMQPNGLARFRGIEMRRKQLELVSRRTKTDLRLQAEARHGVAGEEEAGTAPFSGSVVSSGRFSSLIRR